MITYTESSKTPTATQEAPTDGGVNLPLLIEQLQTAFPGRSFFAVNISGYGATIKVTFNDDGQTGDEAIIVSIIASHDPNVQTADQTEDSEVNTDLQNIQTNIDNSTSDINTINDPGGLKDQLNSTDVVTPGLKAQLQTLKANINNTAWNPLTDTQRIALLRTTMQSLLDILISLIPIVVNFMTIVVDVTKSVKFLLKYVKRTVS